MCIISDFDFFLLETNKQSDKGFLLTSKVCPNGLYALASGLYACKISLQMCIKPDFKDIILKLATYGQREKAFLLSSKLCPKFVVCPARGYIHVENMKKKRVEIVLKLATNRQSDKGFLLTSTCVPKGLSAPVLGLYSCIKALKYIPGPGVRRAFTGPPILWFLGYENELRTKRYWKCNYVYISFRFQKRKQEPNRSVKRYKRSGYGGQNRRTRKNL